MESDDLTTWPAERLGLCARKSINRGEGGGPYLRELNRRIKAENERDDAEHRQREAKRDAAEDLYAVVKAVEWSGDRNLCICPSCGQLEHVGHAPDCTLAAALAKAEAPDAEDA